MVEYEYPTTGKFKGASGFWRYVERRNKLYCKKWQVGDT
jgi:hypothetical protein